MNPRQLRVLIATFSYGGNGGISSEVPSVRDWLLETVPKMEVDKRVDLIRPMPRRCLIDIADTPITMSRNQAVMKAREHEADVLLMIDSDMWPDLELDHGDPSALPFWDVAFDAIYEHYDTGPLVVGAPYCGGSPANVYVFKWAHHHQQEVEVDVALTQYTREEAEAMSGLQPCAALPTGLIAFDMRAFELSPPAKKSREEILRMVQDGKMPVWLAKRQLEQGWFYYEYPTETADGKCSTEDVTVTRDISLMGEMLLGYNPLRCAWDSWAGHWKPIISTKPKMINASHIGDRYRRAMDRREADERQIFANHDIPAEISGRPVTVLEGNGK